MQEIFILYMKNKNRKDNSTLFASLLSSNYLPIIPLRICICLLFHKENEAVRLEPILLSYIPNNHHLRPPKANLSTCAPSWFLVPLSFPLPCFFNTFPALGTVLIAYSLILRKVLKMTMDWALDDIKDLLLTGWGCKMVLWLGKKMFLLLRGTHWGI